MNMKIFVTILDHLIFLYVFELRNGSKIVTESKSTDSFINMNTIVKSRGLKNSKIPYFQNPEFDSLTSFEPFKYSKTFRRIKWSKIVTKFSRSQKRLKFLKPK